MKHNLSRILLALGLAIFAGDAFAQASQNVNITAAVKKSCAFSGVTDVTFATEYDPNDVAALSGTGEVLVQCTKGTSYYWSITDGTNLSGGSRRLADAAKAEFIPYAIEATSDASTYTAAPTGMVAGILGAKSTARAGDMSLGLRVTLATLQDVSTDVGDFTDVVSVDIDIVP